MALDDEAEIQQLGRFDAIADTLGSKVTTPLLVRLNAGGVCGTVVTPPPDAGLHPGIRLVRIMAHPDPAKVREFADDFRDGSFVLPIVRRFDLRDAADAQAFAEKGGAGGKVPAADGLSGINDLGLSLCAKRASS